MRFRDDRRAAALQVGAILLFGFVIILMSIWQAQVIPEENAKVEFEHYSAAQTDMMQLRSDYIDAAESGTKRSATVKLGTAYPTRIVFVNAPPPRGRLHTTIPSNGTITASGFDVASVCGVNSSVKTRSLQFDTEYSYLSDSETPPYIYENTVLYRQTEGGGVLYESDQALVRGSTITLYPFTDNVSRSGQRAATLDFSGTGTSSTSVTGSVSITLPTDLTADQWAELLKGNPNFENATQVAPQRVRVGLADTSWTVRCASVSTNETGGATGAGGSNTPTPTPTPTPSNDLDGDKAFADADDDLQLDPGETTYNKGQLYNFDKDVNLVIPSEVGGGTISHPSISIEADKITSRVDMTTTNDKLSLSTDSGGQIDVTGSTIDTQGKVSIKETGSIILDDVTIRTNGNGKVNLESQASVSADGSDIKATSITASATDDIAATNARLTTTNDMLSLEANSDGTIDVTGSTIDTQGTVDIRNTDVIRADGAAMHTHGNGKVTLDATDSVTAGQSQITAKQLSVTADDISMTSAELTTTNSGSSFDADYGGQITVNDSTIDAQGTVEFVETTEIEAADSVIRTNGNGKINLDAQNLASAPRSIMKAKKLTVQADEVGVADAELTTTNGGVTLSAQHSGPLNATGVVITSASTVELKSSSDMILDGSAAVTASGGSATATLGSGDTLYVDGLAIDDSDDTLIYSPNGVNVVGDPDSGTVEAK